MWRILIQTVCCGKVYFLSDSIEISYMSEIIVMGQKLDAQFVVHVISDFNIATIFCHLETGYFRNIRIPVCIDVFIAQVK